MAVFYAYVHNVSPPCSRPRPNHPDRKIYQADDDNTWRLVLIFGDRTIADEWWRAMSTLPFTSEGVKRIAPQFYTHDVSKCNLYEFFSNRNFKPVSDKFRGKMFTVLENDKSGRGISIIPPQDVTDHISGNW
jgi:hypothetical protein